MKAQFFTKRGSGPYYRCGACAEDRPATSTFFSVDVGINRVALLCPGCVEAALKKLEAVVPHSFPELDAIGNLL